MSSSPALRLTCASTVNREAASDNAATVGGVDREQASRECQLDLPRERNLSKPNLSSAMGTGNISGDLAPSFVHIAADAAQPKKTGAGHRLPVQSESRLRPAPTP
eukprot:2392355-Pleurochrysis_carterae.AAC.1